MKILMLLSNPFMVDPRVHKEATALVEAGHEVTIIVWDRKKDYSDEEVVDGVRVIRFHNSGFMNRFSNDLLRNPLWWWGAYKMALKLFKEDFAFDVVHCHDLDTLVAGVLLKKKLSVRLVYDAHEMFGYMIYWDVPHFVSWFVFVMERFLVQSVDKIITVTVPVADYFKSICSKEIILVMNCKDLLFESYQQPKEKKEFVLTYIGVLHKRRFFPQLIEAVGGLEGIKLILAAKRENLLLYDEVEKLCDKFDNINFLGPIPHRQVVPTTLDSDAVICIIDSSHPATKVGITTKLFDAMVCSRPIIVSKGIHSADIVQECECGVVVEYSVESVRKEICRLRDNPSLCKKLGSNGLNAAKEKYNWEIQKKRLIDLYEKL